ncbi:MAG TPA: tetratricopeptide repeat protein [Streptosporangiaceae bacterium]
MVPLPGAVWPARTGTVPPLAEPFTVRDSVPGAGAVLVPGTVVALVPGGEPAPEKGGWAGTCGKTQLAAYFAEAAWQSGEVELLAWVNASSRASVLAGYMDAAARLGLDDGGDAEQVAARVTAWLGGTARRWLVVADDVRDRAGLDGLLPAGPSGTTLVTAADAAVVPQDRLVTVPAGLFSLREAVGYLHGLLATDPDQRSGSYDLATALGGEPAALAHAAAVLAGSGVSCNAYQRYFAQHRKQLRAAGHEPAAAVTWMLSAEFAEELLPGGGTWPMLLLAALLGSHGIPSGVLTGPAACQYLFGADTPPDPRHAQSALQALERAGLVTLGPGPGPAVWMSSALQAAARAAAPAELLSGAVRAAAGALLEAWPAGEPRSGLAPQMRACAEALLDHGGDAMWDGGSCHRVLLAAGRSLDAARMPGPAAGWWQQLTERSARLLGDRHPDTVEAAGLFADALLAAGQAGSAVTWAQWVLTARAEAPGPDHRGTIGARARLGRALAAAGRPHDAVTLMEATAGYAERVLGPGDAAALSAAEDHAAACLAAGQPREAARLLKRVLAGREETAGADSPAALAAGEQLAAACLAAGQFRDATRLYGELLARCERARGPGDPATLAVLARLAGVRSAAGQVGEALRLYQQAAAGYERALGAAHPATLACQAELARAYCDAGHLGDAVTILRSAITSATGSLLPGDPAAETLRGLLAGITEDMAAQ